MIIEMNNTAYLLRDGKAQKYNWDGVKPILSGEVFDIGDKLYKEIRLDNLKARHTVKPIEQYTRDGLESLGRKELLAVCKKEGIEKYTTMKSVDIIDLILQ